MRMRFSYAGLSWHRGRSSSFQWNTASPTARYGRGSTGSSPKWRLPTSHRPMMRLSGGFALVADGRIKPALARELKEIHRSTLERRVKS